MITIFQGRSMSINKSIIGLTLSLLLSSGVAVAANFSSAYSTYLSGDYKAAFKEMLPSAEQGSVDAQYWIAAMYGSGKGVPTNDKTAVMWWTLAAEQGHTKAQYNLGVMYGSGKGVPTNDKTAVKWYTLAAKQGYAQPCPA